MVLDSARPAALELPGRPRYRLATRGLPHGRSLRRAGGRRLHRCLPGQLSFGPSNSASGCGDGSRRAARVVPNARTGPIATGGGIVFVEMATAMDLQHAKRHTDALRRALRDGSGPRALVTGQPAIQHDLDPMLSLGPPPRRGDRAARSRSLVLLAVFGLSLAVLVPFVFAACTITGDAHRRLRAGARRSRW